METTAPLFTIALPTYNRADKLPGWFEKMAAQTCPDFEVIVVDDGSSDNTTKVVRELQKQHPFTITYIMKPNQGRMTAINKAIEAATGQFFMIMDDDDYLLPEALETVKTTWDSLSDQKKPAFCGVAGLCQNESGEVIGDTFPTDPPTIPLDTDFFSLRDDYGVKGDKKEVVLTSLIKGFRFPYFKGEKRGFTNSLWFHLAKTHKARCINTPLCVKDYLAGGLSKNIRAAMMRSPRTSAQFYEEMLATFPKMTRKRYFTYCVQYQRFCLHAGECPDILRFGAKSVVSFPLAVLIFFRDKLTG